MRNLLFKVCTVVLGSVLLLSSCDKDHWDEQQGDCFYGYKVENRDVFDLRSITHCPYNQDTAFLTGIKNEKHWIGMFDQQTKKQLQEWNGSETIDREIKTDRGYGEIETMRLSAFHFENSIHKTSWGFAMVPYYTERDSNWGVGMMEAGGRTRDILLLNGDKMFVYPSKDPCIVQSNWFHESIIVDQYRSVERYIVLSPEGKELAELKECIPSNVKVFPISYAEGITVQQGSDYNYEDNSYTYYRFISRRNYATAEDIWKTPITSLQNIEDDARISTTVLEQGSPIWKYRIDVTNRDGSKQQVLFTVNVETGALTEI